MIDMKRINYDTIQRLTVRADRIILWGLLGLMRMIKIITRRKTRCVRLTYILHVNHLKHTPKIYT